MFKWLIGAPVAFSGVFLGAAWTLALYAAFIWQIGTVFTSQPFDGLVGVLLGGFLALFLTMMGGFVLWAIPWWAFMWVTGNLAHIMGAWRENPVWAITHTRDEHGGFHQAELFWHHGPAHWVTSCWHWGGGSYSGGLFYPSGCAEGKVRAGKYRTRYCCKCKQSDELRIDGAGAYD